MTNHQYDFEWLAVWLYNRFISDYYALPSSSHVYPYTASVLTPPPIRLTPPTTIVPATTVETTSIMSIKTPTYLTLPLCRWRTILPPPHH